MAKPIKSSGSQAGKRRAALTPEGQALVDDYHMLQYYWSRHFAYDSIS